VEPYVLDARRCISYLTIEKRSALAPAERRAIGEWLFGCDICQDVCPFNHGAIKSGQPPALAEFEPGMGVGPVVDLAGIVDIPSEGEFRRRFSHTALSRARRKTLIRNAVIVAANTGAVGLTARIARRVHEDPSPLVRQHALWAVWMLEHHFRAGLVDVGVLLERARRDSAPEVRDEARDISEGIV
jgi:epoxyqueuosine reductase